MSFSTVENVSQHFFPIAKHQRKHCRFDCITTRFFHSRNLFHARPVTDSKSFLSTNSETHKNQQVNHKEKQGQSHECNPQQETPPLLEFFFSDKGWSYKSYECGCLFKGQQATVQTVPYHTDPG